MNVKSARRAAEFVRCCSFDPQGRLEVAIVPGHDAKLYQVQFSRAKDRLIVGGCVNPDEGEVCKGHRHNLCFHALAALICAADKKGLRLIFCSTKEKAECIAQLGGVLVEIVSRASHKGGWVIYRSKKKK